MYNLLNQVLQLPTQDLEHFLNRAAVALQSRYNCVVIAPAPSGPVSPELARQSLLPSTALSGSEPSLLEDAAEQSGESYLQLPVKKRRICSRSLPKTPPRRPSASPSISDLYASQSGFPVDCIEAIAVDNMPMLVINADKRDANERSRWAPWDHRASHKQ